MKKTVLILIAAMMLILSGCAAKTASAPDDSASDFAVETLDLSPEQTEEGTEYTRSFSDELGAFDGSLNFDYFDDVYGFIYEGFPEDAYYPSVSYATGTWKYIMDIRYDSSEGYYFAEIGYADFSIDYDKELIIIDLHPRIDQDGFEAWEVSDEEIGYEAFEGGIDEDGGLKLIGNDVVLYFTDYFASGGREYLYGNIYLSEEDSGYFFMVRGQD